MSRVRILNLPKDCTEEQLRHHILSKAPATAPPLQITDVFIKRGPRNPDSSSSSTQLANHNAHLYTHRGRNDNDNSLSHPSNNIRMAFVGFQTAAAGKFVVQYFHRTYFKSSCLHVEPAKSVQDAQLMVQEKESKRREKRMREEEERKRKRLVKTEKNNLKENDERVAPNPSTNGSTSEILTSVEDGSSGAQRKDSEQRRLQFLKDRSGATTGATWTSELLLPDTSSSSSLSSSTMVAGDEEHLKGKEDTSAATSEKQKQKKTQKKGKKEEKNSKNTNIKRDEQGAGSLSAFLPGVSDTEKGVMIGIGNDKRELEDDEKVFQRQRELGSVSEVDFLAALGGNLNSSSEPGATSSHRSSGANAACPEEEGENGICTSLPHGSSLIKENPSISGTKKNEKLKQGASYSDQSASSSSIILSGRKGTDIETEDPEALAFRTARVRLLNIPYVATESNIKQYVTSQVGPIQGIHIPLTKDTRQSKGTAFIRFARPEDAVKCLKALHGAIFMGRLVRVMAAEEDPYQPIKEKVDGGDGREHLADVATIRKGVVGHVLPGSSVFKEAKASERRAQEEEVMMNMISDDGDQKNATTSTPQSWNPLYVESSAAVQQVAKRMHLSASDLVSVDTKGAATRAAIAEALLTSETHKVLGDEGIALDVLNTSSQNLLRPRSSTTILVKNVVLRTSEEAAALSRLFSKYGVLELSAFPQSGLFALLRFTQTQDARVAFRRLSFKLFQGSPLYLEWAPVGSISTEDEEEEEKEGRELKGDADGEDKEKSVVRGEMNEQSKISRSAGDKDDGSVDNADLSRALLATQVFTLYISNIPFNLSEEDLYSFLLDACPRFSKQPEKYVKRLVYEKEKGRAFMTMDSSSSMLYAQRQWNGRTLQNRVLQCVPSKANSVLPRPSAAEAMTSTSSGGISMWKAGSTTSEDGGGGEEDEEEDIAPTRTVHSKHHPFSKINVPAGCDPLKIVVKNLPFEATEQDVRALFSAFSEIRSVRLPRKAQQFSHHRENHHRGFAFVEFLSESEAVRALETLRATHLYGRHLVLEYAKASS